MVVLPLVPVTAMNGLRQQAPAELELAEDGLALGLAQPRRPEPPAGPRALDDVVDLVDELGAVGVQVHFDAEVAERVAPGRRPAVDGDHAVAEREQQLRRRLARPAEADHEVRAGRDRRARERARMWCLRSRPQNLEDRRRL